MQARRQVTDEQGLDSKVPTPKGLLNRRELLLLAAGVPALALAANAWLKTQPYLQGEVVRMFQMGAKPERFDLPGQRRYMMFFDMRDVVSGHEIQIQLPKARIEEEVKKADLLMHCDSKDDLIIITGVGAFDDARWGKVVTEGGKRIMRVRYDQVELRRGELKRIREAAANGNDPALIQAMEVK
jgi:hypothetical protein